MLQIIIGKARQYSENVRFISFLSWSIEKHAGTHEGLWISYCTIKKLYQVRKSRFEWNPMIWSVGNPFSIMHESKYTNGWSKIFCWKIWRNLQHSIVCLQSGIGSISGSKGFVQMCCSFHLFLLWSQNYVAKVFVSAKQFYLNWLFWLLTSGQFCNSCELFCQRLVMTGRLGFSR